MAAAVAFPLDIASLSTTEVVFLMPLSIRLAPLLRKASFVFLMIAEHPHLFESCACVGAWQARRGGVRRQLGGTPSLDWDISHRQRVCWEHHDISRA